MSRETLINEPLADEEFFDAVNDEHFSRPRSSSRADTLRVRRQVEALLEERRLKRAIEDDWLDGLEEEE